MAEIGELRQEKKRQSGNYCVHSVKYCSSQITYCYTGGFINAGAT